MYAFIGAWNHQKERTALLSSLDWLARSLIIRNRNRVNFLVIRVPSLVCSLTRALIHIPIYSNLKYYDEVMLIYTYRISIPNNNNNPMQPLE